jgi:KaiC/GvpD/RAD55 family RecA-like ATPase
MFDVTGLKQAANGRWVEIISRIGAISADILDGGHHPCPRCGGIDRFRMIDAKEGACLCNQCFSEKNGDGISAVMWLCGIDFKNSVSVISRELGMDADAPSCDVIQEMAWRKGISSEALKLFGATIADRGGLKVCRVPMFDSDMKKVGDFDMAPTSGFEKGKMTQGSSHGLFVAQPPSPNETVCLVEGVKDACALVEIGMQAIGLPTSKMDARFSRMFRECNVVVVPDRDTAGIKGAEETASRLFGVAASVKIAELPADFKEVGGDDVRDVLRKRDGKNRVLEAIKNARPWMTGSGPKPVVLVHLSSAVLDYIENVDNHQALFKTGLPYVDKAIGGGVLPGEMVIIAGRPSHGKTVVGMQMLDRLSMKMPVLIISEEMSVAALAKRTICGITTVAPVGWSEEKDSVKSDAANHFTKRYPHLIAESCGTVERAYEAIEKAKTEYNIGAVAIDYVQMLRGKGSSRYEQVSDVSTKLKQIAVKHDLILVAVCQLNREVEKRTTEKKISAPKMSDLRDTGQLEQDADVILFVEWISRSNPESIDKNKYRILVAKNRNREISQSVLSCVFMPERQRLYYQNSLELEQNEPQPIDDFMPYSE